MLDAILQLFLHHSCTKNCTCAWNKGKQGLSSAFSSMHGQHAFFSTPLYTAAAARFDLGLCFEHYVLDPVSVAWENKTICLI